MKPIEVMYEEFGKHPVNPHNGNTAKCGSCLFFKWKITGPKENRIQAYRWCEIYGLNKADTTKTDWNWDYEACDWFNKCEYPEKNRRNLYRRKEK